MYAGSTSMEALGQAGGDARPVRVELCCRPWVVDRGK